MITNDSNISLNKLKYLYINDITFEENRNVKIDMNNLLYLDIRLQMSDEEKKNFEDAEEEVGFPRIF